MMDGFNQWEDRIIQDINCHYIGSAKVDLSSCFVDEEHEISLNEDHTDPNFLREVLRLMNTFETTKSCPRRDPDQHMRVVIDPEVLRKLIEGSGNSALGGIHQAERVHLRFPSEERLWCLNSLEMMAAAKEYLEPDEQWWCVDFYDSGKTLHTRF